MNEKSEDFNLAELLYRKELPSNGSGSKVEQDSSAKLPLENLTEEPALPYFGQKDNPAYTLQQEKEVHRAIVYLAASCHTNKEIAEKLGVTTVMVAYVRKQDWAKKMTSQILARQGGDIVRNMLKNAAPNAAEYLIGTVVSGKDETDQPVSHAVRSANAKEILDRVYGKSAQVVLSAQVDPKDLTDEELVKAIQENGGTLGTGNSDT